MARAPADAVLRFFAVADPPGAAVRAELERALGAGGVTGEAALFLAASFPDLAAFLAHLASHGCDQASLPLFRDGPVRRWKDYCHRVERQLRGTDEDATARSSAAFGVCRRCGSARLVVTTRQLRRPGHRINRRCPACAPTRA